MRTLGKGKILKKDKENWDIFEGIISMQANDINVSYYIWDNICNRQDTIFEICMT